MVEKISFRELHGIERDPRWPHVDGCVGGCMGCGLEDAVLAAGGTAGRDWLFENMPRITKEKPKASTRGAKITPPVAPPPKPRKAK
jgi:hypothetical protein